MADEVSVKISELTRVNSIKEKDVIPFSTSLITGTETTNAVPVAVLRMILSNPTVYENAAAALADSKANDYVLIYSDFTKSAANIFLFDGSTLNQLTTTSGNAVTVPIGSSATGVLFQYTAAVNDVITIPSRLIGTTGYYRILIVNKTYPSVYGEYVLSKSSATDSIEMSSSIVENEGTIGKILLNWPAQLGVGITFKQQGLYEIRIY